MLMAGILVSCQDDLHSVEKVELDQDPPDRTIDNAEYFYSDSGLVRNRLRAGKVMEYHLDTPYTLLSDGVELVFYRAQGVEGSVLTSEEGTIRRDGRIMQVREDVRFENYKGEVLLTERLTWLQDSDIVYTNDPVSVVRQWDTIHGIGLTANEDFSRYEIKNIVGKFNIKPDEDPR